MKNYYEIIDNLVCFLISLIFFLRCMCISQKTFSSSLFQIWMLTGDKMETAICIAQSSRLVAKTQSIYQFKIVSTIVRDFHLT